MGGSSTLARGPIQALGPVVIQIWVDEPRVTRGRKIIEARWVFFVNYETMPAGPCCAMLKGGWTRSLGSFGCWLKDGNVRDDRCLQYRSRTVITEGVGYPVQRKAVLTGSFPFGQSSVREVTTKEVAR